jgi:hypothetical protein
MPAGHIRLPLRSALGRGKQASGRRRASSRGESARSDASYATQGPNYMGLTWDSHRTPGQQAPGTPAECLLAHSALSPALDRSQAVTDASGCSSSAFPAAPAVEDPRNGPRPACHP